MISTETLLFLKRPPRIIFQRLSSTDITLMDHHRQMCIKLKVHCHLCKTKVYRGTNRHKGLKTWSKTTLLLIPIGWLCNLCRALSFNILTGKFLFPETSLEAGLSAWFLLKSKKSFSKINSGIIWIITKETQSDSSRNNLNSQIH